MITTSDRAVGTGAVVGLAASGSGSESVDLTGNVLLRRVRGRGGGGVGHDEQLLVFR